MAKQYFDSRWVDCRLLFLFGRERKRKACLSFCSRPCGNVRGWFATVGRSKRRSRHATQATAIAMELRSFSLMFSVNFLKMDTPQRAQSVNLGTDTVVHPKVSFPQEVRAAFIRLVGFVARELADAK